MSHVSVLELAQMPGSDEYGYKLVKRNGQPARAFNDPANGEKAPKLIAHDWQQHGFREECNGHVDEMVAIGAQWFAIEDFINENGGLGDFIGYQLAAYAMDNNGWDINYSYTVNDTVCNQIIQDNWEEIVRRTNNYLMNPQFIFGSLAGDYTFDYLQYEDTHVRDVVCRMFTKGYRFAKKVYKTREFATETYNKIVAQLKPYVTDVSASSPTRLYLHVQIHKGLVEVKPDEHQPELTTA